MSVDQDVKRGPSCWLIEALYRPILHSFVRYVYLPKTAVTRKGGSGHDGGQRQYAETSFPERHVPSPLPLIVVGIVVMWHLQGVPPWLSSFALSLSNLHCSRRLTRILLCSDLSKRSKSETRYSLPHPAISVVNGSAACKEDIFSTNSSAPTPLRERP